MGDKNKRDRHVRRSLSVLLVVYCNFVLLKALVSTVTLLFFSAVVNADLFVYVWLLYVIDARFVQL